MKRIKLALIVSLFSFSCFSQSIIKLYPNTAPGSENWNWVEAENDKNIFNTRVVYNVTTPTLTAYLPQKNIATGTAVIIAPGGGFQLLSIDSEGIDVAKYLSSKGVAAFVLKYRLAKSQTTDPTVEMMEKINNPKKMEEENVPIIPMAIQDALEAIKHVRNNASVYDIDPSKIGIMGFSAGGTVTLGAAYVGIGDSKPNFVAPIYAFTDAMDKIKNIPKENTPIFIAVASDDQLGFAQSNAKLYLDWKAAGQPAELHVFEKGGHGFGMRKQNLPTDTWNERFGEWLKMQGYLKKKYPADWEKNLTDEQIAEQIRKNSEIEKRDWTNLRRYRVANSKLPISKGAKPRIVFTGDSITDAWASGSPEFFENNNYVGRGISGQTSPQTLLRFRQDVIDLKPQAIVINIGINDIAENTGDYIPEFTLGNYRTMIEAAKANKIKVILASVLPAYEFPWRKTIQDVPAKVIALNVGIKKLAEEYNLVYLDYFNTLKDERNGLSLEMAKDGVHPTKACYKIMEKMVSSAIKDALKN